MIAGKEATHERILDAAAQVFAESGYHGASVDDIARTAGSSKGAIYFHFPGKREIFFALVNRFADRLLDASEAAIDHPASGSERAGAAVAAVLGTFSRHRMLAKVLLASGVGLGPAFDESLMALHERFAVSIRRYLDAAVVQGSLPPQDTELAAYAWMGALNEVILRWLHTGKPEKLEDAASALQTLLLRSVGATSAVADGAEHREDIGTGR
ncbi:MAG: TetR/AcrR family transcriptional regulator [Chloroflexi bacterium]|nr:TetR/AcrR family transcriptional regulator [Chloroflexota bacterium]